MTYYIAYLKIFGQFRHFTCGTSEWMRLPELQKGISQGRISLQSHALEPTYFSTIVRHIHLCCSGSYKGTCWRTSYGPIIAALHKNSIEPDMKADTHAQCHVTSIRIDVKISHSKLLAICVWWYTSLLWTSDHHLWSVGCNILHGGWCLTVRDNR